MTIEQIANTLNSTPSTIYQDLTVRLTLIETDKQILTSVANILRTHSLENIIPKKYCKTK